MGHYVAGSAAHSPAPVTVSNTPVNVQLHPLSGVSISVYYLLWTSKVNRCGKGLSGLSICASDRKVAGLTPV